MKSILLRIAAAIRAFAARMGGWVKEGGRWVYRALSPGAMPAMDTLEPDAATANDNAVASENQALRDLAYCQVTGRLPTPAMLGAVTALQADWIAAMDNEMARRLLKSTDREINAHLRGIKPIRGIIECSEDAVDDYVTATAINRAILERDLDLDQYRQPSKMPA